MTQLYALWLPVVLSAVLVFVVSSIIHMALPWHRSDYPKLPNEDRVRDALRPLNIPPGDYMVPRPTGSGELRSPAFQEKLRQGPVLMMTVWPNGPSAMGRSLVLWFVYAIVVGVLAAFVAGRALPPGAGYRAVFKFAGVTAFAGYALALWQASIWYRRSWLTTLKLTIDGFIYACLTAAAFAWLWPR